MSEPTLTGMFNVPLGLLADMIAGSATFKTAVGAASAAQALAYVVLYGMEDEELATLGRPFVLLDLLNSTGSGPAPTRRMSHDFLIQFEFATPTAYAASTRQALKWFMNTIGAIFSEMAANEGRLRIGSWEKLHGPARSDKKERKQTNGDYLQVILRVSSH